MVAIQLIENFIDHPSALFDWLKTNLTWDDSMMARKTASFGRAYNYSQLRYPYQDFIPELKAIVDSINERLEFEPNNCLINYYVDGNSKMGFHSDQIDMLHEGTGVAILSLGETRTLRFRNIKHRDIVQDYHLPSGSLIYVPNEVQTKWQHAVPRSETTNSRMSLTFRKMK